MAHAWGIKTLHDWKQLTTHKFVKSSNLVNWPKLNPEFNSTHHRTLVNLFVTRFVTSYLFFNFIEMGSDVNVTCGGREIIIAISSDYIQRNLEWLENGNKLSLTDLSCKAVQDRSGNRIIRIRDDFTKCGNRITTDVSTQFSQRFHTSLFFKLKQIRKTPNQSALD